MRKKILIIDDDATVRYTLRRILLSAGYAVLDAPNGKKGVQLFQLEPADLVITDIIMPEQEGIETIIELKSREPQTRIIAISGGGRTGARDLLHMAERLGADAVLHKPFDTAELIKAVKEKLAA
ncbi:MAG TPA: response regulator [Stellaceae bacterium]|jgi:CheY-like chemotaxis protein|nr:response regulator [Stellaceae bacterium]